MAGPWSNRPGSEIGAAVSGVFCIEGTPTFPKSPVIVPICDNVLGWLEQSAYSRRCAGARRTAVAIESSCLLNRALAAFARDFRQGYAAATAGSSDEHTYVAPDLFTAETALGTYQGMTDQVVMSRTKESYRTVLAPRGSSKPQWLEP
jgi:hypothetical protein